MKKLIFLFLLVYSTSYSQYVPFTQVISDSLQARVGSQFILKKTGISGLSTGATQLLGTFNSSRKYKVTSITIALRTLTAVAILTQPTITIGSNASTYNNVVTSIVIVGTTSTGKLANALTILSTDEINGNLFFNIGTAGTGTSLSVMTFDVTVTGVYTD